MLAAACGSKTDLTKVKEVYARWEKGWLDAKPCLFGKIERAADPRLQIELSRLFGERPNCPSWLNDTTEKLPGLNAAQLNKKAREKELDEKANAINVWTLLEPSDLTDELADDAFQLVTAVKAFQKLQVEKFDDETIDTIMKLANARQRMREHLGLPADHLGVTRETPVMALTVTSAPPPPPPTFDAALAEQWNGVAKDLKGWSEPRALADKTEPIVWIDRGPRDDFEVRVFQLFDGKWKETKLTHVAYVDASSKRLDVVYRTKAPSEGELHSGDANWRWFGAGKHDDRFSELRGWGSINWMCSSESFLWIANTKDSGTNELGRMRMGFDQTAESVETSVASGGTCNDEAVADGAGRLCTLAGGCRGGASLRGMLVDAEIADIDPGPPMKDGQFLVLRTSSKKERVLRLPPGSKFGRLIVRDRKPVITLASDAPAVPAPVAPINEGAEPNDYKCGGDDRIVPRVGCKCPEGEHSARAPGNVAICAPGKADGSAAPPPQVTTPKPPPPAAGKEAIVPWPIK